MDGGDAGEGEIQGSLVSNLKRVHGFKEVQGRDVTSSIRHTMLK